MLKNIIGGVVTVLIGGTLYSVSQTDIAKNFAENTGVSQQQAEEYVNSIKESDLSSFTDIGEDLISDSKDIEKVQIDCENYDYEWESYTLSCENGRSQLKKIAKDEAELGYCYKALDTDLGDSGKAKIQECIVDIDKLNSDYSLQITSIILDNESITEFKNNNAYNKSILQAALSQ